MTLALATTRALSVCLIPLSERRLLGKVRHLGVDARALILQEVGNRPTQTGVRDPVRG